MPTKERLESALINAHNAGDTNAARVLANALKSFNEPSFIDELAGVGETALSVASGFPAEVAGGVAGVVTAVPEALYGAVTEGDADIPTALGVQQTVSDFLTYDPRTTTGRRNLEAIAGSEVMQSIASAAESVEQKMMDMGVDAQAGPVRTALAVAFPTMALELLGAGIPARAARSIRRAAETPEAAAEGLQAEIAELTEPAASREGVQQVAEELSEDEPDIAQIAQFDRSVVKAAQELGFDEIPPGIAAGNAQFRDIAQGMASIAGSQSKAQYGQFVEGLANRADDLIREGGGDIDKAALSARYFDETERTIKVLGDEEGALYGEIESIVKRPTRIDPNTLRAFIDNKITEFGGVQELPPIYKKAFNLVYQKGAKGVVHPGKKVINKISYIEKNPTYGDFNQYRQDVGAAIGRKSSPYSDAEFGTLKNIYAPLKNDQKAITNAFGAQQLQDAADALTIKRNAIQDTKIDILGRDLSKDLMPQVAAKITALPKGNVKRFAELIEGIPENMRSEVIVSALNDIMKGTGADQKGLGSARFVGFMNDLQRSPTAQKELYKYLPTQTRTSLNNLYTLANATYKANRELITTGKISQFFPEQNTFISRLMGAAKGVVVGKAGLTGGGVAAEAAAAAADNVVEFLSNTTDKAKKANEFLSSQKLQNVIKSAVRDGVVEGGVISRKTKKLEQFLEKSDTYRRWADGLEGSEQAKLASIGVVNYLLNPEDE